MSTSSSEAGPRGTAIPLSRWVAVATAAWILAYAFNALALDGDLSWTRAIFEQKRAIAASLAGQPRILFVGGSNVHYSVDALEVERQIGIRSVNLGLHAGLGLNAILNVTLPLVQPDDVVVAMPEYGIVTTPDGGGWLSGMFGAAIGRPGIGGDGARQTAREVFQAGVTNQTSLGKGLAGALFGLQGRPVAEVDERGSTAVFLTGSAAIDRVDRPPSGQAVARLERFASAVNARGARLLIGLPWVLVAADDRASFETVRTFVAAFDQIAPVLADDRLNLKSDASLFSDSSYHLTKDSRRVRSTALAAQVATALKGLKPVGGQP